MNLNDEDFDDLISGKFKRLKKPRDNAYTIEGRLLGAEAHDDHLKFLIGTEYGKVTEVIKMEVSNAD